VVVAAFAGTTAAAGGAPSRKDSGHSEADRARYRRFLPDGVDPCGQLRDWEPAGRSGPPGHPRHDVIRFRSGRERLPPVLDLFHEPLERLMTMQAMEEKVVTEERIVDEASSCRVLQPLYGFLSSVH
jgi:hypothetical protein